MGFPLVHSGAKRHRPQVSFHAVNLISLIALLRGCLMEARPPHPSPIHPTPHSPPTPHWQPPPHFPPSPTWPPPPPSTPSPPPPPSASNCTQFAERTEGPYWIEENIKASNVRLNLTYGVPLNITFKIANGTLSEQAGECVPIEGARVDLWSARYDGVYSDVEEDGTVGETWLRGYQLTNSTGYVTFYTIFPGWYTSRTVHIHIRVRIYAEDGNTTLFEDTTQLFFNDTITAALFTDVYPYNSRGFAIRDTYNSNDPLFTSTNMIVLEGNYTDSDGYRSLVDMSLPYSFSVSLQSNGARIISGERVGYGFASIK
ncbi:hypothetical protein KP509_17G004600 [Ceratopteris richardii]|uniref:Intradiol ring-cleavage dioxygenases domain-containing protein n=1 Tax=Ceratopteris richardii TaxID=49495 RepID=A0A8T2SSF1_CERRI|nr:hypothetical protein KP509_17G004600 [Ceratopteris richardii]